MNKQNNSREKILEQASYWVEGFNSELFNAILDYMEKNKLNRTQLAKHLGLSKGRVSQILNDGEINYSIEKLVEISLKVGKFPLFSLEDKKEYFCKEREASTVVDQIMHEGLYFYMNSPFIPKKNTKTFSSTVPNQFDIELTLN